MKLEVGKYYETEDGLVFGPMRPGYGGVRAGYHWESLCGDLDLWCDDGLGYACKNLVREHIPAEPRTHYVIGGNVYRDAAIATLVAEMSDDEVVTVQEAM